MNAEIIPITPQEFKQVILPSICCGVASLGLASAYILSKVKNWHREYGPRETRPWPDTTMQDISVLSRTGAQNLHVDGDTNEIHLGKRRTD